MFVRRILPQFQDNLMKHVLIYVPSYFDFVRLRNYFKSEAISCALVCEYSKVSDTHHFDSLYLISCINFVSSNAQNAGQKSC